MTSVIHIDQVGFIRGCSSSDNIRRFINIKWSVANDQIPVAAISLDTEKAFDMVEWDYLFKILEMYRIRNTFTGWIKLLYSGGTKKWNNQIVLLWIGAPGRVALFPHHCSVLPISSHDKKGGLFSRDGGKRCDA